MRGHLHWISQETFDFPLFFCFLLNKNRKAKSNFFLCYGYSFSNIPSNFCEQCTRDAVTSTFRVRIDKESRERQSSDFKLNIRKLFYRVSNSSVCSVCRDKKILSER